MLPLREIFLNRRMLLMLVMGFASGFPLALVGGTLQAWLKDEHVDITTIGIFSLVGLPYTLKFLWAPLMDRYVPSFLGRRRGWMLVSQILLIAAIGFLGTRRPAEETAFVALIALCIAFLSASQDIVIDAYRTEWLTKEERGPGASVSNLGYRLAMLTSGAVALIIADHLPWNLVYWIMAALLVLGIIATFSAEEPQVDRTPPRTIRDAVLDPLFEFFKRRGSLEILLFIAIYKLDIVLAAALTTPFMMDIGFSKEEIGAVAKGVGLFATILGSLMGGALYTKFGLRKSLWVFGIIQGFSTLAFSILAEAGNNIYVMGAAVGFENFCSGLSTAPFIAFLMSLCNKRFTATQFALLTSLSALTRVFAGAPTGWLVTIFGWTNFFVFCAVTAIPGLLLLKYRFHTWEKIDE